MAWFGKKKSDDADVRRQAARNINARDIAELEAKIKEYESEKSAAHGDLDRVSDELVKLEKALVGKKREYDQATGARKGIVKKEFMLLDRNFRLKQGEPELIQKKLEQYDTLIASAQEAIRMLRGASVVDDARSIGEKHEEGFASMQEDAAAVGALSARRRFKERFAVSRRPAAFKRGPITKPMVSEFKFFNLADLISS